MRLIRLVWPAILVVTLGAVSAAGSEPGSNVDPDRSIRPGSIASDKLASGAAVVGKVCVMPAEGQMGRETFKGREGMSKGLRPGARNSRKLSNTTSAAWA